MSSVAPPYRRIVSPQPSPDMKHVLAANWSTLEAPPPPTLRELLAAYKSRGDGDREMLLVMLAAKSAEDQRIAAVASLQRTLLEMYQGSSPPLPPMQVPDRPAYYTHPPPAFTTQHRARAESSESRASSSQHCAPQYAASSSQSSVEPPRKCSRRSPSPMSPSATNAPPSPYSSRSESAENYPRRQTSSSRRDSSPRGMTIGSLVSGTAGTAPPDRNGKRKGSPA